MKFPFEDGGVFERKEEKEKKRIDLLWKRERERAIMHNLLY